MSATAVAGSPSRAVLSAFAEGVTSLAAVAKRTGLSPDVVPVLVDELVRAGLLQPGALSSTCPTSGGCGGRAAAGPTGAARSSADDRARGQVLLTLGSRAPTA